MIQHIMPTSEVSQHERSTTCVCCPIVISDGNDGFIVNHQSFDGIEVEERGFVRGNFMGITSRDGKELVDGDVVESVKGERFVCTSKFGRPAMIKQSDKSSFFISDEISLIWFVGNIFEDLQIRHDFFKEFI